MNSANVRFIYRLVAALLVVYWITMFVGTHVPAPPVQEWGVRDKTLHFSGYFGLGFLLSWLLLRARPTLAGLAGTLLIIASYGAADELTQELVPSRSADAWDWLADFGGGVVGVLLYLTALGILCLGYLRYRPTPANSP